MTFKLPKLFSDLGYRFIVYIVFRIKGFIVYSFQKILLFITNRDGPGFFHTSTTDVVNIVYLVRFSWCSPSEQLTPSEQLNEQLSMLFII